MTRRAIVSGAGVAGLAAGILLRRADWDVELHEAADAPGGLLRPVLFRGLACDMGSHRLHPAALAEPLLAEVAAEAGLQRRVRRGRIVLERRHLPYPLTLPGLLAGLGPKRAFSFGCAALHARRAFTAWDRDRTGPDDVGFEAFVLARAGRAAYEAFYRPYAEKVWGLDPREISQSVARQRVSAEQPLRQVARALLPGPQATYLYPRRGFARLHQALHDRAVAAGVRLHLGQGLGSAQLPALDADVLLHSGHLRHLAPAAHLRHRGLYLLFLALPTRALGEAETWYTPEARYWFGRVGVIGNYSEAQRIPGETALCLEIPEGRWGPNEDFTQQLEPLLEQLTHARILPPGLRPLEVLQRYVPDVYPLYTLGWQQTWRAAMTEVADLERVLPIGRQGLFLHCNVDHAVAISRAAMTHLAAGGSGRDWPAQAQKFLGVQVRD